MEMMTLGPGGWRVIPEPEAMRVAAWRVVIVIVRGSVPVGWSGWVGRWRLARLHLNLSSPYSSFSGEHSSLSRFLCKRFTGGVRIGRGMRW